MTKSPYNNAIAFGFLGDGDIAKIKDEICKNLLQKPGVDDYHADSSIQPAALDLHIGKIYVPGANRGAPGSADQPILTGFDLHPGRTALIETHEVLTIPSHIMGIGFAPIGLALKGILTPTIGHINPGWNGPLKIVTINMGGHTVSLEQGSHIAGILLYRLVNSVSANYTERKKTPRKIDQAALNALAPVFADFEDSARNVAIEANRKFEQRIRKTIYNTLLGLLVAGVVLVPLVALVTTGAIQYLSDHYSFTTQKIHATESDIGLIKLQLEDIRKSLPKAP